MGYDGIPSRDFKPMDIVKGNFLFQKTRKNIST